MKSEISEKERHARARQRAFSIRQFSEIYSIGRTKIYEELKSGRLRARKIGKHTVILEDDAENWLRRLPVIELGGAS
jgi:excisionase family DNA binding protein